MASLKEIKSRIGSIKSTRKITSAMRMVASAKLHKAQAAIENMLPYQQKMNSILTNFLSTAEGSLDSPYTIQRELQRVAIVVFSSNNSLCGAFNANVIRMFVNVVDTYKTLGYENIIVYPIGKKIEEAVRKMGYHCQGSFQQLADKPSYDTISEIADELMQLFINEEVDKIDIIFHHFRSQAFRN